MAKPTIGTTMDARAFGRCRCGVLVAAALGACLLLVAASAVRGVEEPEPPPLPSPANAPAAARPPRVLILCSYHHGHSWTDGLVRGQIEKLSKSFPSVELTIEYLDEKRFPESAFQESHRRLLEAKYRQYPFDLVITNDNAALELALDLRGGFLAGVPIVFAGVNGYEELADSLPADVTGVAENIDFLSTIEIIPRLIPGVKTLEIIIDTTESGQATRRDIEQLLAANPPSMPHRFLEFNYLRDLERVLRALPEGHVALMCYYNRDQDGTYYDHEASTDRVVAASTAPVFGVYDFTIGRGVLGGYLLDASSHGAAAAGLAVRVLRGEPVEQVARITTSPCPPAFDWAIMEKWGVDPKNLPPGAALVNRPPPPDWHRYRWHIAGTAALVLFLSLMVAAMAVNLAARRRAERELRASEATFRSIVESSPMGIYLYELETDGKLRFAVSNPAADRMTKVDNSRFIGMTIEEAFPALSGTEIPERYHRAARDGENWLTGSLAYEHGGISGFFEVYAFQISPGRVAVMFNEISERKRQEDKLKIFMESVANSSDAIGMSTPDGRHYYQNAAFDRLFGDIGDNPTENLYAEKKVGDEVFTAIMAGDEWSGEVKMRAADKTTLDILLRAYAIKDGEGRITALVGVHTDVTEYRRAQAERESLREQLNQSQKMESVGRLAGGVAHDFNNMLCVILGHTEVSLGQIGREHPLAEDLREIQRAAERSADLTRQLLAFARKQTVAPKVLNLNEAVEGMLKMLRRLIGEDIDLVWAPATNLWTATIDPSQVDQVLANLGVNARDAIAGDQNGKVTIETANATLDESYCASRAESAPGEYVMLAVSDNGRGIDKEAQQKLFEPFFTTKGIGEGTGLGLCTVYGIVKQNQGFINVYSEPGGGSTFKIYLPRCHAKTEEAGIESAAASAAAAKPVRAAEPELAAKGTILLVEDEPVILTVASRMLASLGYRIIEANGPDSALRQAGDKGGEINLLMTDVVMPGMNGRELAAKIAAANPGLKCLFMSGYTADVIAPHGILDENIHFIQKPFTLEQLAKVVAMAIEQPR